MEMKTVSRGADEYPAILAEIPQPPEVLHFLGDFRLENSPSVAIVGTRKATRYGLETAYFLSYELARSGVLVVSGLALGIDAAAHKGAVDAGGKTIAVLGSGVKNIHPKQNKRLADSIIAGGGAVVSEFPPEYPPDKWTFPQRNRIVAGLSRAVIVVEAPKRSGALITARMALDCNRDVGAVPGEINSVNSEGTNALLKSGAAVIRSAEDVLELLGLASPLDNLEDGAQHLLNLLAQPMNRDELLEKCGLEVSELFRQLTLLELEGRVKNVGGTFHRT